jgi:hypothetical protein
MTYTCSKCGEQHEGLPDIGFDKPAAWFSVPEDERADRVKLDADTCVIDNQEFYIRGVIEIPIHDYPQTFGIGVWVSQKKENFFTYLENSESSKIGPFFGWLCCTLGYYEEETQLLKTRAHFRGRGLRPSIELEPTNHQLSIDQRDGISLAKAWDIVHYYVDAMSR